MAPFGAEKNVLRRRFWNLHLLKHDISLKKSLKQNTFFPAAFTIMQIKQTVDTCGYVASDFHGLRPL